jgi:hypothetical protein
MQIEINEEQGIITYNGQTFMRTVDVKYTVEYCKANIIAIHCKTEASWRKVLQISNLGNGIINEENWGVYKTDSCIIPYYSCFGKVQMHVNYTIISAETFLKHNQPDTEQVEPKWGELWEVLEFQRTDIDHSFYLKEDGCYYVKNDTEGNVPMYLEDLLNYDKHNKVSVKNGTLTIHSIKRKSDQATFTVGHKVIWDNDDEKVEIEIKSIEVMDALYFVIKNGGKIYANECSPIPPKQPLFTTHDGVDVFDGDWIHFVNKTNFYIESYKCAVNSHSTFSDNHLRFSSNDAAVEYVKLNKPCLSIQNILDSGAIIPTSPLCKELVEALKELVKV